MDEGYKQANSSLVGIAFVKFAKASSAAFALEALNGTAIEGEPALKVMFAEPQGSVSLQCRAYEKEVVNVSRQIAMRNCSM